MMQGIRLSNISIDCRDTTKLRDFYAGLLGVESCVMFGHPALRSETGFALLFMEPDSDYAKPVWPEEAGQQQKQMHLDFQVADLDLAVKRAEELGARRAESQFGGGYYVTMIDPEGHPFCLCLD